ncbi:MAG: 4Fe-4S dicluster domain-containing protein [Acidimicrobiales bacterium]|nr:4Fe-4S dicluster domain-containing protein [Acidimicrobiales bacterium]
MVVDLDGLARLVEALQRRCTEVIGPVVRDAAVVLDRIETADDLPAGWTDDQAPGRYRLRRRQDAARFGHALGPHAWKRVLHPPRERLWRAERAPGAELGPAVSAVEVTPSRALLGVRACDLAALAVHDRIFGDPSHPNLAYQARRAASWVVAVQCTDPGGTCFCASLGTGPAVAPEAGADLTLTEVLDGGHRFVARPDTARGADLLAEVAGRPAGPDDEAAAAARVSAAAGRMGRALDPEGLPAALAAHLEHPRWEQVADRCLACGSCALVCPTCFCSTVEDVADLDGSGTERWRRWDTCFTADFSYIHGGTVRASTAARYRQWLLHKLSTWADQFGSLGCVGCGRCITWCPVGIDLVEEASAVAGRAWPPDGIGGAS